MDSSLERSRHFYLRLRATIEATFNGFAEILTENGVRFVSFSISTPLTIVQVKKLAQNAQTPNFRFVHVESIPAIFFMEAYKPTPDRFQIRYKVLDPLPHPVNSYSRFDLYDLL